MSIIIGIIPYIIGLWILYAIIKGAIDNSETAENIRQIRMILSKLHSEKDNDYNNIPEENFVIDSVPITECPACNEKISPTDKKCPSCGLALRFEEDDNSGDIQDGMMNLGFRTSKK